MRLKIPVSKALGSVLMLALAALALTACGKSSPASSASASSKAPFRLLAVIDTSGPVAIYGQQQLIALKGSVAYWNSHGGIGGRKITLSYVNGNGDPSTATTSLIQWISANGKPDMVFDGESGVDDSGIPPEIKRAGVLSIGEDSADVCVSNAQQTCPTRFSPVPQLTVNMTATAQWMHQQGYKKVGLLVEEDGFSQSEVPLLKQALSTYGITTVTASFPPTAVDVTPELTELESAGVNAVWGAALAQAAGYIATARADLGLVNKLPIMFDAGAASQDLTKLAPVADFKNAYESISRPQDPAIELPGRTALYAASAPYGQLNQPQTVAIVWDSLVLAHDVARQAGSTDVDAMVKALDNLGAKASTDPLYMYPAVIKFTEENHQNVGAPSSTYQIVKVGPLNADGEVTAP
jgi:ABC-type branched-subunit amino acid transport system substrate-binding protein